MSNFRRDHIWSDLSSQAQIATVRPFQNIRIFVQLYELDQLYNVVHA